MANSFKDFIPEGEDLGAFSGGTGFADFAPDPIVKPQEEVKPEPVKINVPETKEKKK